MGIPGLGKDRTSKAVGEVKSALDTAREGSGAKGDQATRLVQNVLDLGIDGKGWFDSAAEVADAARRASGGDAEKAVEAVISKHLRLAGAAGFVTSLGGFITWPVALPANVLGFYLLATRMTAAVARLRGHDIGTEQIRTAVLLTLVGADADDLLRKAGAVAPSGRMVNLAAQRLPGPALMVVNKGIGFRLLATAGKGALTKVGKLVPVVGGVIGAGVDAWMLNRIADNARREFPPAAAGEITAR